MTRLLSKLKAFSHRRFGVKPLAESVEPLEQWLQTPLGEALIHEESALIDTALRDIYGYHLMQLGISRQINLTTNSTINHRFSLSPKRPKPISRAVTGRTVSQNVASESVQWLAAHADPERLPIGSETVDLVLLHHALEFTPNPHQLLRETARIIIPRGTVVIVGFNPLSWFGLVKQFGLYFTSHSQWRHHSLRLGRILDWLRLLDFEPVSVKQGFFRWPINHPKFLDKTHWYETLAAKTRLPMGGFYIIVARKDLVGMIPIKPSWKLFNPIENLVGARPTTRVSDPARDIH